jgi:galactosyl transferase GMA12/MNN10 family
MDDVTSFCHTISYPANSSRWVDADSIIINPALPVEIFLPPHDFANVHFLVTKDHNGLNTGIFFVRVHEWSVKMMAKALAYPMFQTDVDLGTSADQAAIARIFNETEFSPNVLYQPRVWYNTYEFHHGFEGQQGDLLVHFPGLEEDRWRLMSDWLDTVEGPKAQDWETTLARTRYPEQIDRFWTQVRECRAVLADVRKYIDAMEHVPDNLRDAVEHLSKVLSYETDQIETMRLAVEGVKQAIYLTAPPSPAGEA